MEIKRTRRGLIRLVAAFTLVGVAAAAPAQLPATDPAPDLAGQELDLTTAVSLAVQHSPQLRDLALAEAQAWAEADQVGRGPNPELGLEIENFAGSGVARGFSAAEYTLLLSQTFEMGGKRDRAREATGWQAKRQLLEAKLGAREIEAQVTRAFVAALAAQAEVALAEQLADLARQDLEFTRRLVAQGAASPVENNRAEVAVASAALAVATAKRTLQARKIRLAGHWQSPAPTFGELVGALDAVAEIPAWESLRARLATGPAMQRLDLDAGARRAAGALAVAQGKIDLTAAAGLRHYRESGDNAVVAAVSFPLPLRDRNQDGIKAAQLGLARLAVERQARQTDLLDELSGHYEQLSTCFGQVVSLRDRILPLAEQSMTAMDAAYRKGLFSLTDVLAVRRTWYEARGAYAGALADCVVAAVAIDLLLGDSPLDSPFIREGN